MQKNNFLKKSSYLFDEFLESFKQKKGIGFFRRTVGGYLLMIKVMEYYYRQKNLYVEDLIRLIPISIISRSSLSVLINQTVDMGYFIKISYDEDRRKKLLKPSHNFIDQYENWLNNYLTNIIN
jgi:hypothetical protein